MSVLNIHYENQWNIIKNYTGDYTYNMARWLEN